MAAPLSSETAFDMFVSNPLYVAPMQAVYNENTGMFTAVETVLIKPPVIEEKPFVPFLERKHKSHDLYIDQFYVTLDNKEAINPNYMVGLSVVPYPFCCGVSVFGSFLNKDFYRTDYSCRDGLTDKQAEYWGKKESYVKAMEETYKRACDLAVMRQSSEFRATVAGGPKLLKNEQLAWIEFLLKKGWKVEKVWNSWKTGNDIYNLVWRDERTKNVKDLEAEAYWRGKEI